MRHEPRRFIPSVHGGGKWELEPDHHVLRHVDRAVVIEGVRTGFDRLEVVRIKREGKNGRLSKAGRRGSIAGGMIGTSKSIVIVDR